MGPFGVIWIATALYFNHKSNCENEARREKELAAEEARRKEAKARAKAEKKRRKEEEKKRLLEQRWEGVPDWDNSPVSDVSDFSNASIRKSNVQSRESDLDDRVAHGESDFDSVDLSPLMGDDYRVEGQGSDGYQKIYSADGKHYLAEPSDEDGNRRLTPIHHDGPRLYYAKGDGLRHDRISREDGEGATYRTEGNWTGKKWLQRD